jgi:UDP-N-acetylglucosamine--N-acetylmuramyl-(pentapeptide) pyrophosphoryl-undecaprenol N-acetylglucosamine transferase
MCYAYAAADLAICRAGASSIFELAAARIPMILVPLGKHASRGDQIINAQIFVQNHWAQCINEHDFHTADIEKFIEKTFENLPEKKQALQNAPGTLSATQIGKMIWAILKKNEAKKR